MRSDCRTQRGTRRLGVKPQRRPAIVAFAKLGCDFIQPSSVGCSPGV